MVLEFNFTLKKKLQKNIIFNKIIVVHLRERLVKNYHENTNVNLLAFGLFFKLHYN